MTQTTPNSGRIRFTLVEVLVVVSILGILSSLLWPSKGPPPPLTDKDLHLDEWRPGPADLVTPSQDDLVADVTVRGLWRDDVRWTTLSIQSAAEDRLTVAFVSHGRCGLGGRVELTRTAIYRGGVLLLDRPVREVNGLAYRQLYTLRRNDSVVLVPQSRLAEWSADRTGIPRVGVMFRAAATGEGQKDMPSPR